MAEDRSLGKPKRRDPHRERGRLRAGEQVDHAPEMAEARTNPAAIRRIPQPAGYVIVLLDPASKLTALQVTQAAAIARELAAKPETAVVGMFLNPPAEGDLPKVFDRVLSCAPGASPDVKAAALLVAMTTLQAGRLIYWEDQLLAADVARRYAARVGAAISADTVDIDPQAGSGRSVRARLEITGPLANVIGLHPEFECLAAPDLAESLPMSLDLPQEASSLEFIGRTPLPAGSIPLPEAEFIISAGAGLSNMQDFLTLAENWGASVAGSREACDALKVPRERQVGTTGSRVGATVYLAFGISGAPQHLEGIEACRHVVAVNTDPSCAMLARAELSVIGDANDIVRHLRMRASTQVAEHGER